MPQITAKNRIVLKAMYGQGGTQHMEGIAGGAVKPGQNVVMTTAVESGGGRNTFVPGATTVNGGIKVATENILLGQTVNDAYVSGDNLEMHLPVPGDHIQVLVASGQTVAKGGGLLAAASGLWTIPGAGTAVVEALESSGGVALTADTLMRVRVL
jgi:hypothetical protein